MNTSILKTLAAAGALALAPHVHADLLITVDVTNPNAVTFSATSGASSATASVNAVSGFTLMNFLTAAGNAQWFPSGGNVSVGSVVVNDVETDGLGPFGAGANINFATLGDAGNPSFSFTTGMQALSGSVTIDMTGLALPSNGASGSIQIGRQSNSTLGAELGTWQVVNAGSPIPEPASASALAGLAGLGWVATRRRHRRG